MSASACGVAIVRHGGVVHPHIQCRPLSTSELFGHDDPYSVLITFSQLSSRPNRAIFALRGVTRAFAHVGNLYVFFGGFTENDSSSSMHQDGHLRGSRTIATCERVQTVLLSLGPVQIRHPCALHSPDLGYDASESYGIAYKARGLCKTLENLDIFDDDQDFEGYGSYSVYGDIDNSKLHNNVSPGS